MNLAGPRKQSYSGFPINLLLAVKGDSAIVLPRSITKDIQAGIAYAISTLGDKESSILLQRFDSNQTLCEIAEQFDCSIDEIEYLEVNALKKLRHPSRWNFIQHGIVGFLKVRVATAYNKGYTQGYSAGYTYCTNDQQHPSAHNHSPGNTHNLPIENMGLSSRTYHCLKNAGYLYVHDIAGLDSTKIARIRGLGAKSANEVAIALQKLGLACTIWSNYIL